jgi:hypothetical protein
MIPTTRKFEPLQAPELGTTVSQYQSYLKCYDLYRKALAGYKNDWKEQAKAQADKQPKPRREQKVAVKLPPEVRQKIGDSVAAGLKFGSLKDYLGPSLAEAGLERWRTVKSRPKKPKLTVQKKIPDPLVEERKRIAKDREAVSLEREKLALEERRHKATKSATHTHTRKAVVLPAGSTLEMVNEQTTVASHVVESETTQRLEATIEPERQTLPTHPVRIAGPPPRVTTMVQGVRTIVPPNAQIVPRGQDPECPNCRDRLVFDTGAHNYYCRNCSARFASEQFLRQ